MLVDLTKLACRRPSRRFFREVRIVCEFARAGADDLTGGRLLVVCIGRSTDLGFAKVAPLRLRSAHRTTWRTSPGCRAAGLEVRLSYRVICHTCTDTVGQIDRLRRETDMLNN